MAAPHQRAALSDQLLRTGVLPLKQMATLVLEDMREELAPAELLLLQATDEQSPSVCSFELTLGTIQLQGTYTDVYNRTLVQVAFSKREVKYLIDAYIRYLAGVAAGCLDGAVHVSTHHNKIFQACTFSAAAAEERLQELIGAYEEGLREMQPFFSGFDVKPGAAATLDEAAFQKIVRQCAEPFGYTFDDPYVLPEYRRGFFKQPGQLDRFRRLCSLVIDPLSDCFPDFFNS
jgi:exodeoxyribonuclease V gamma subunit